jgi:hypothetical protein
VACFAGQLGQKHFAHSPQQHACWLFLICWTWKNEQTLLTGIPLGCQMVQGKVLGNPYHQVGPSARARCVSVEQPAPPVCNTNEVKLVTFLHLLAGFFHIAWGPHF